jgi:oligoribonuclease (3'-5' exoribonuclease)
MPLTLTPTLVFLDLETTGTDTANNRIVENIEAGLASFKEIVEELNGNEK